MVVRPPSGVATLVPMVYDLQGVIEGDSVWTLTLGTVYPEVPSIAVKSKVRHSWVPTVPQTSGKGWGQGEGRGRSSWGEGCWGRTGERDVGAVSC